MGACTFSAIGYGKDAKEAFAQATTQARYLYGHGGYTGSIAEKHEFVLIDSAVHTEDDASALEHRLIENDDHRIVDKWGPAAAIEVTPESTGQRRWLFFGWASS